MEKQSQKFKKKLENSYEGTKLKNNKEETREEYYGESREDIDINRIAKNRNCLSSIGHHDRLK